MNRIRHGYKCECGNIKFKTARKNHSYACRACGKLYFYCQGENKDGEK
jgi:hypothetical protein